MLELYYNNIILVDYGGSFHGEITEGFQHPSL